VARESSACGVGFWRGTAAARRHFAFWKACCAEAVHSNVLVPPPPSGDQSKGATLAIGQKTAVKIYHAEKTLQLFDVLRGWAEFDFGRVTGCGGCSCCRNHVAKNLQRGHCKNTFFKIDGKTIGGQGIEKSFQMAEVCLPVWEPILELSMYANTPSIPSVVRSIIC
jgi:hypothetical protein